jgi:phosphatidylserine/phosphatidylglycerophosphate/cardiolipin synthase-like enzyme
MTADLQERVIVAPEERRQAVLDVIDSAHERLQLSLFRCDDEPVMDALAAAVRRGVLVRALLTSRAKRSKKQLKRLHAFLQELGADVRRYADPVVRYHAKYVVADDGPGVVASLNFTRKCFEDTCDFLLVSRDAELVVALTRLFDADWCEAARELPDLPGDRLIVGPEQARRRFEALLRQATRRIRLIDPKISDPAMLTLLKEREADGIEVDVRAQDGLGSLVPHGKLLLIDDSAAVLGSISLSTLALEFRRELAVVIREKASLRALDEFWKSLPSPSTRDAIPQTSRDAQSGTLRRV